jgi:transposase-like protein
MTVTKTKVPGNKVTPKNQKIRDYLVKHPEKAFGSYSETAKKFGVTSEVVRHQARTLRDSGHALAPAAATVESEEDIIDDDKPEFVVSDYILARRENAMIKSMKKQLEEVTKEYESLSDAYDMALAIKTQETKNFVIPKIKENKDEKNEATAIVQLSDTHFGKIILPSTVNGLNEHNPEIAKQRMEKLAENLLKLIKKERSDVKIDNLVLGLGGDFMENSMLHDHSQMATAFSQMEELLFSREMLHKFITTIANNGKFKKILIPCVRGNHSRTTKKMNSTIDYRTNFEAMLYNILKQDFSDSLFEWYAPDSDICEFQVYDKKIRSLHGWQVKSGGGIGGLTIPLNKYILRMDQISKCDHNLMHHYHSLSYPTANCTLNGSLCGYDTFAMQIGASFQKPMQAFQLLDKTRGFTIKAPIFCE